MNASPLLLARFSLVQMCYQTGSILILSVGLLAATPLAPSPLWAGVPLALSILGTLVSLFPASALMARWGRKRGLLAGVALGSVGVVTIVAGLVAGRFEGVCIGFLVYGFHQSLLRFLRSHAMQVAGPGGAARALSWVLGGAIPAALLGPLLGLWGRQFGPGSEFSGSFLLLLGVLAVEAVLVATLPSVSALGPPADPTPRRRWAQRWADPSLWLALAAAAFGNGLMVMLVSASPVAMHEHGHSLAASTVVLQAYVLGLSVPSFFSGLLVKKWGPRNLIVAGLVAFVLEFILGLQGTDFVLFLGSLTLLGVGSTFLSVGGTNLLVTRYRPSEKAGIQAFNDTFVYSLAAVAAWGAGAWERGLGWDGLQWLTVPFLVVLGVLWWVTRAPEPAPGVPRG